MPLGHKPKHDQGPRGDGALASAAPLKKLVTLLFAVAALQPEPEPDGEEANRAAEAALRVHAHPAPPGRVCVLVLSLRFFFPTGRDSHTRTQMIR